MKYDIYINDTIGWPISASWVRKELAAFRGKPCSVYINSLGGSVTDALDIYQQLRDHGQVTAYVFGLTASAATIIACGAQQVLMSNKALLLVHRTSQSIGLWEQMNEEDIARAIRSLEKSKDMLRKIDQIIASIYAEKSGGNAETFRLAMQEAVWLTAARAKDMGLCDDVIEEADGAQTEDAVLSRLSACALPALPEAGASSGAPQAPAADAAAEAGGGSSDEAAGGSAEERREGFIAHAVRRLVAAVRPAAQPVGGTDTDTINQPSNNMDNETKKTLGALCALLAVASIAAAEDGSVCLTAAQAEAVDKALGRIDALGRQVKDLQTERDDLQAQVDDLQAQVDDLAAGDGAETSRVEGGGKEAADDAAPLTGLLTDYERLKGIL